MTRRLSIAEERAWRGAQHDWLDSLSVERLPVETRVHGALLAAEADTIGKVRAMTDDDLIAINGIGPAYARDIRAADKVLRAWLNRP